MQSKPSKKQLKEYCVHLSMEDTKIENIMARTPEEAMRKAKQEYDVTVEIMRTCSCGLDNDIANTTCEDCGKNL